MAQQPYLSRRRYELGGFGMDTSGFTNAQMRSILARASVTADAFCNNGLIPERTDFRGGSITAEQHTWQNVDPLVGNVGSRRVYLNRRPIRTVTGFAIKFTNNYQITLPADNLYVNAAAGYVEVVASQPTIVGFPPLGYWFGLSEPIVETSYTYGWQFVVTGDELEADSTTLFYATHGSWLPGGSPIIYIDGAEQTTGYTINEDDGSVTFDTEPAPGEVVTADYTYALPQAIADAIGIIATDSIGASRNAGRGLTGLSSLRVAEVALTVAAPQVNRGGVSIPSRAADLLMPFVSGRIG